MIYAALITVASYLAGSIPTGVIIAKFKGIDLRNFGSGNIGATNVTRALGKGLGAVTLLGDAIKGFVPVYLMKLYLDSSGIQHADIWLHTAGAAAFIGHLYSVFLRFTGGKGVATALGVYLAISPAGILLAALVWLITFLVFRLSAGGALAGAVSLPVIMWKLHGPGAYAYFAIFFAAAVVFTHRENIVRIVKGDEKGVDKSRD
jgi:glycerol-3-phosphate acyltransferase PlsY